MINFQEISKDRIDISELLSQLEQNADLWDVHPERKVAPGSPHYQMSDIWVRFRARDEITDGFFNEPHLPVWYPSAEKISSVKKICHQVMTLIGADILGGVLITKIPPGGKILPHDDKGGWHAEYYNNKIYVPLQSDEGCINYCEEDEVHMKPGSAWIFDNLKTHSVENNSQRDRITLIICTRID